MEKPRIETVELVKIYKRFESKLRAQRRNVALTRTLCERLWAELERRRDEAQQEVGVSEGGEELVP